MSKEFIIIAFISVILVIRIKNFGIAFRSLNTLIHELSHAIMALVTGGEVLEIKLNDNASGSCTSKTKGGFKSFLVSSAGYSFSALFSYLLFYSNKMWWNKYFFYFFLIISVIALIFWIRNLYGIIWTLCFASLNLGIILVPNTIETYGNYILFIFALIIMLDNIFATITLFYLSLTEPKKAGDATNIAKSTKIPAFFWALLFLFLSAYLSYKSYLLFHIV